MINETDEIHIMNGNKLSKQFIIAVVGVLAFIFIIGYCFYVELNNYDFFLSTIKEQKMTLTKVDEPIKARDSTCSYQIHFEALDSSGQAVRGRYCGAVYYFHGKINIKEIIKK